MKRLLFSYPFFTFFPSFWLKIANNVSCEFLTNMHCSMVRFNGIDQSMEEMDLSVKI